MLDLAGCWTLSDESGAHVIDFDLPGDGVSALAKAGVSGPALRVRAEILAFVETVPPVGV